MEKNFTTTDIYLTAAISLLLNIKPAFEIKNSKILFLFPISDDLYKAMTAYNNDIPLPAMEFVEVIKKLRAEMMIRRNAGKNGI